jgi:L-threonylcarbamoyladenylate synthase
MTEVVRVDAAMPDAAAMADAAERVRRGQLVAFPTETVYGLGVHALDRQALSRLFLAKNRPASDPVIVHVASLDEARPLVSELSPDARLLAACFWPGPLTLVLPRSSHVPDEVTAGLETVAVRAPAHPVARALLTCAGVPIAAPSANLFSRPSPTTAAHVLQDLDGRIDLVLDGGPTPVGIESTVVDLSRGAPVVLRPGAVTVDMLRQVLPALETLATGRRRSTASAMPSPGMLEKHYAPRAPMTLYQGPAERIVARLVNDASIARAVGDTVGILAAAEDLASLPAGDERLKVVSLGSLHDSASVAAHLYGALRGLDAAHVDVILARAFPLDDGLGAAIHDRLRRAAGTVVDV